MVYDEYRIENKMIKFRFINSKWKKIKQYTDDKYIHSKYMINKQALNSQMIGHIQTLE